MHMAVSIHSCPGAHTSRSQISITAGVLQSQRRGRDRGKIEHGFVFDRPAELANGVTAGRACCGRQRAECPLSLRGIPGPLCGAGPYSPGIRQITLHQGAIEAIFLDSMRSLGVTVDRPILPSSIELSADEAELKDPNAHPVKVRARALRFRFSRHL